MKVNWNRSGPDEVASVSLTIGCEACRNGEVADPACDIYAIMLDPAAENGVGLKDQVLRDLLAIEDYLVDEVGYSFGVLGHFEDGLKDLGMRCGSSLGFEVAKELFVR